MKKIFFLLLIMMNVTISFSQNDTLVNLKNGKNRYGIWFLPSSAKNIYGIAIGPFGSETICNRPYTKYTHGLNIQIPGQGFFQIFYFQNDIFKEDKGEGNSDSLKIIDTIPPRAIHNGILISALGTFTNQINGLSFSLWMSMGHKINGVSFNLLWNMYEEINGITIGFANKTNLTNGIQIGVVNKTKKLNGIQLGLWNVNEKRGLPFINWNFMKK